jgi:hypothetical protein
MAPEEVLIGLACGAVGRRGARSFPESSALVSTQVNEIDAHDDLPAMRTMLAATLIAAILVCPHWLGQDP